jgi:hypothetical protein
MLRRGKMALLTRVTEPVRKVPHSRSMAVTIQGQFTIVAWLVRS